MPAVGEGARSSRKGQSSCDFCRLRKLRCNRPLPCTNCVSRGKKCHFGPAVVGASIPAAHKDTAQQHQKRPVSVSTGTPPPLQSPQPAAADQADLLAEIQALRRHAQDLEKRVIQSTSPRREDNGFDFSRSLSASSPGPGPFRVDVGPAPSSGLGQVSEVSEASEVSQVVAHLERVSMIQSSHESIYVDDLLFRVERVQAIPRAPSYTASRGKPTRCVWLPRHDEARLLLDKFVTNVSYIHHVVHHPSLPAAIDDIYRQIGGQGPIKPGHLVLLLSIVASATFVWAAHDDVDGQAPLFSSSAEANAQTPLWIKATQDVLNAGQNCPALSLETIQGIIILSFLICNLEGVSLRYRSLISTGLLLSRELGLHRIDHESNAAAANTIQAEMGRRVWWYLVATDWLLSARYDGPSEGVYQANPRQMMVKKPRNINDVDLLDNGLHMDLPISQPTEMSYFLQRIRMAEIARSIVDHNSVAEAGSGGSSYYTHVMAMDAELDQMIRDIPSFFHLDNYERSPDSKTSGIFIQAYMLNSIIHTQRCKLHLTYLSSGPNNNPAYASSRETCLKAARQIIRAEAQLERAQHPFVLIRLRLSAILYGVFMASIVLLMDACVNGTGSLQDEIRRGEVAEALRIVEDARSHSLAAANLHESLTQVLARHRAQHQQQQTPRAPAPPQLGGASGAPVMNAAMAQMHQRPDQQALLANPTEVMASSLDRGGPMGAIPDQLPVPTSQPPYCNQLAQNLEQLVDLNGFQWDDLLSGIDSSSFF